MLSYSGLRAIGCVDSNKVQLTQATVNFLFFIVDDTEVSYDLRKGIWNCLCIHEAYKGPNTTTVCYHIKAATIWLKQHRENWPALKDLTEAMEL